MPIRVPTYEGGQAREVPTNFGRVSPEAPAGAFGLGGQNEQISRAVNRFASGVGEIAAKAERDADQLQLQDYEARLTELQTRIQIESENRYKGKESAGSLGFAEAEWQKGTSELSKMLSNDRQRRAAQGVNVGRFAQLNRHLQFYTAGEIKKYETESTENFLKVQRDNALLNYQSPEDVDLAVANQEKALFDFAERNGLPDEWLQQRGQEARSQTYASVIGRMVNNGEDLMASNFFKSVKKQMTGEDAARVEKLVEESSINREAQRRVDAMMSKNLSMAEMFEESRKIKDTRLRDETNQRIRADIGLRDAAREEESNLRFDRIADAVEAGKGLIHPRDQNMEEWLALDNTQRNAIDARIKQLRAGTEAAPGGDRYYDLRLMAANPEMRGKFMRTDLRRYRAEVTNTEFEALIDLQTKMLNGDDRAKARNDQFSTKTQVQDSVLQSIGLSGKLNDEKKEQVRLFRATFDQRLQALEEKEGRIPTTQDYWDIANTLGTEVVTSPGMFFDTKKRLFEITGNEEIDVDVDDIPLDERRKIEAALNRAGYEVTDEMIVEAFLLKAQGVLNRGQ